SAYAAPGSDADAHFAAHIQCEDDIAFVLERAEFSSIRTDEAWEIIGTEGTLHLPMIPPQGKPNEVILDTFVPGKGVVSETIWKETDGGETDNDMDNFMRAIREGSQPATGLERALRMQKMTDAIYASAKSGASVSIG
ncbi:MAG: hypothetical protein OSB41_14735, partial [Kiritimatiellae bacterium]|nr:hypothetical protein [Kiritimatiellia bacterium]